MSEREELIDFIDRLICIKLRAQTIARVAGRNTAGVGGLWREMEEQIADYVEQNWGTIE